MRFSMKQGSNATVLSLNPNQVLVSRETGQLVCPGPFLKETVRVLSVTRCAIVSGLPTIKERRKVAALSGIEMFRQLLGNECALLSPFQ